MSRKMTLNRAWKECLAMRKWISEVYDGSVSVFELKLEYSLKHNTPMCSFCTYNYNKDTWCGNCPGVLVDPDFSCLNKEYHHDRRPREFYEELLRLDRIRKSSNIKRERHEKYKI